MAGESAATADVRTGGGAGSAAGVGKGAAAEPASQRAARDMGTSRRRSVRHPRRRRPRQADSAKYDSARSERVATNLSEDGQRPAKGDGGRAKASRARLLSGWQAGRRPAPPLPTPPRVTAGRRKVRPLRS